MMITLLNTSILTDYGMYYYEPMTLDKVKGLLYKEQQCTCYDPPICLYCGGTGVVRIPDFQSAIGHQATAEILTELLGAPVLVNRIQYVQGIDDTAIVFKLKARAPEGKILNRAEVEEIGYEFGILKRIA